jgi:hypothetical protein
MKDNLSELKEILKEIDYIVKNSDIKEYKEQKNCKELLFSYKYILSLLKRLKSKKKKIIFSINRILKPSEHYLSSDIKKNGC